MVIGVSTRSPARQVTSFEEFFDAERSRLFRALVLVTRNAHEAEELMQDAFLKVWEKWERVGALEDPTGYLYRTAMNGSRSAYRRAVLALRHTILPAAATDPYEEVEARDEALRSLARLTPRQRSAVVVTQLLGYGFDEAARILGIRPGTVRVLLSQARAALEAEGSLHD